MQTLSSYLIKPVVRNFETLLLSILLPTKTKKNPGEEKDRKRIWLVVLNTTALSVESRSIWAISSKIIIKKKDKTRPR